MRVQITLTRVQPEIQAHATWIIEAEIKAVEILVCDAGAVFFVKESESLLRYFSSTRFSSGLSRLKQKEVIRGRDGDDSFFHVLVSLNYSGKR